MMVYCGEKTCCHNSKGKCKHFKIALNEQGICMGYNPIIMPTNVPSVANNMSAEKCDTINHTIGF